MLWTKGRLGIAPGLKMTKVTFTFFQGDTATNSSAIKNIVVTTGKIYIQIKD